MSDINTFYAYANVALAAYGNFNVGAPSTAELRRSGMAPSHDGCGGTVTLKDFHDGNFGIRSEHSLCTSSTYRSAAAAA
jgi:hypothetical protein